MCIIHESSLHYVFQDILEAFEQSEMLSSFFLKRVGYLICTCKKDIYHDSKTLIAKLRSLYEWFDLASLCHQSKLIHFQTIINEFKSNGQIDSGTKITFMMLLSDLNALDFSKLRSLDPPKKAQQPLFFTKLVKLQFDLKLCSVKQFTDLLLQIDNGAMNYIQVTNNCDIKMRDLAHLTLKHFMGETMATLEASSQANLAKGEKSLKQLADAVLFRLAKRQTLDNYESSGSQFNAIDSLVENNESIVSCDLSLAALSLPKGRNSPLSSTSSTLDDSLNLSYRESQGTATPMTSSPISSHSGSSLQNFKRGFHKKQSKKTTEHNQQFKELLTTVEANSVFENFMRAVDLHHDNKPVPSELLPRTADKRSKKQEKMNKSLKKLLGIF